MFFSLLYAVERSLSIKQDSRESKSFNFRAFNEQKFKQKLFYNNFFFDLFSTMFVNNKSFLRLSFKNNKNDW